MFFLFPSGSNIPCRWRTLLGLLLAPILISCTVITHNAGEIYINSSSGDDKKEVQLYGLDFDSHTYTSLIEDDNEPVMPPKVIINQQPTQGRPGLTCPTFRLPEPVKLPPSFSEQIKNIDRSDPRALDVLMVNYIQSLVRAIKEQRVRLQDSYQQYIEKCQTASTN